MMRAVVFLCISFQVASAADGLDGQIIKLANENDDASYSRVSRRTESSGISLRELLQLLPYLSALNSAPLPGANVGRLPYPALGLAAADGNPNAIGAIAQLAKIITRRQASRTMTLDEARTHWTKSMATAEETVKAAHNTSVGVAGSVTPVSTGSHMMTNASSTANSSKTVTTDAYEFEDYGPPPPPEQLSHYPKKSRVGSPCQKDDECVRGAICQDGGIEVHGPKHCECRPPFVRSKGRCVPVMPYRGA